MIFVVAGTQLIFKDLCRKLGVSNAHEVRRITHPNDIRGYQCDRLIFTCGYAEELDGENLNFIISSLVSDKKVEYISCCSAEHPPRLVT